MRPLSLGTGTSLHTFALSALLLASGGGDEVPLEDSDSLETFNVIEFVLDDVGLDLLELYDDQNAWPPGFQYPATPNIDALAANGVTFRNAWGHAVCSADRAAALTGRHALLSRSHTYGTGIGDVVNLNEDVPLDAAMSSLPLIHEAEGSRYVHLLVGKWHLGDGQDDPMSPIQAGGMTEYRGCLTNPNRHDSNEGVDYEGDYDDYTHTVATEEGFTQQPHSTAWMGSQEIDDALDLLPSDGTPFVLRYWFHYAHAPWGDVVPDSELGPDATMRGNEQFPEFDGDTYTYSPSSNEEDPAYPDPNTYNLVLRRTTAMVEAADRAIGKVLAGLSSSQRRTTIIILRADNGTNGLALDPAPEVGAPTSPPEPPQVYDPLRAKHTLYQQGIGVPLVISAHPAISFAGWIAPSLRGTYVDAICSTVDIWATMADATLPNWEAYRTDGRSLLPVLLGQESQVRPIAFSFHFAPNGTRWGYGQFSKAAARDQVGYKLIRRAGEEDELYDLRDDPMELANLFPPVELPDRLAFRALDDALDALIEPSLSVGFCYGSLNDDCPCANENDRSRHAGYAGCANGTFPGGASLAVLGRSSVSEDSVVLRCFGVRPSGIGVFFQADDRILGGAGTHLGDGLRCIGGSRLGLQATLATPQGDSATSIPLAAKGSVSPGDRKRYQYWFRDPLMSLCGTGFNLSNAVELDWVP